MNPRHIIPAAALGVVAGVLISVFLGSAREPTPAVPLSLIAEAPEGIAQVSVQEFAAIRDGLAFERDARFAMAEELDLVWAELAKLSEAEPEGPLATPPSPPQQSQQQAAQQGPQKWFDTAPLVDAGIAEQDVARMRELFETKQLDELYLHDTASREGWVSTPRYRKDVRRLEQDLRAELGDEDYDRVKFATGRNNRVLVGDVLQNSAAASIGLVKGDIIVRYDGQLMLSPQELRSATVRGSAEETTAIDVLRGSETLRLYVPRGPLGVRISQTRRRPE